MNKQTLILCKVYAKMHDDRLNKNNSLIHFSALALMVNLFYYKLTLPFLITEEYMVNVNGTADFELALGYLEIG